MLCTPWRVLNSTRARRHAHHARTVATSLQCKQKSMAVQCRVARRTGAGHSSVHVHGKLGVLGELLHSSPVRLCWAQLTAAQSHVFHVAWACATVCHDMQLQRQCVHGWCPIATIVSELPMEPRVLCAAPRPPAVLWHNASNAQVMGVSCSAASVLWQNAFESEAWVFHVVPRPCHRCSSVP